MTPEPWDHPEPDWWDGDNLWADQDDTDDWFRDPYWTLDHPYQHRFHTTHHGRPVDTATPIEGLL